MNEKQKLIMKYSNEILDIVNHKDEFTQSDLQAAIEAVTMRMVGTNG